MKNRYTYVMSDIHGDFNRFERAIREIDYDEEKDLLYIIGDAIDRGRKNLEMLNYIKTHPAIRFIKGNHESKRCFDGVLYTERLGFRAYGYP